MLELEGALSVLTPSLEIHAVWCPSWGIGGKQIITLPPFQEYCEFWSSPIYLIVFTFQRSHTSFPLHYGFKAALSDRERMECAYIISYGTGITVLLYLNVSCR